MAIENPVAEVILDLTPGEARHLTMLERRIERGMQTFREVGLALLEIRDKRLFRMSHKSFEGYCQSRWGLERGRAYQLMGAAEVAEALPEGPINEAQARELVPIFHADPNLVGDAWEAVKATGKPITAPLIREVVRQVTGQVLDGNGGAGTSARAATPTTRLIATLTRLTEDWADWLASKPTATERKAVKAATAAFIKATKG